VLPDKSEVQAVQQASGPRPVDVAPTFAIAGNPEPGSLLATVQIRYPTVPVVYCDTRPLAKEWTFRFLGAAAAFCQPGEN
jgi:hypothetical protein